MAGMPHEAHATRAISADRISPGFGWGSSVLGAGCQGLGLAVRALGHGRDARATWADSASFGVAGSSLAAGQSKDRPPLGGQGGDFGQGHGLGRSLLHGLVYCYFTGNLHDLGYSASAGSSTDRFSGFTNFYNGLGGSG